MKRACFASEASTRTGNFDVTTVDSVVFGWKFSSQQGQMACRSISDEKVHLQCNRTKYSFANVRNEF